MIPLVILRPEPGASASIRAARDMGLEAFGQPLFEARPVAWTPPPAGDFDAVIAGSANAFRLGGAGLAGLIGLPVHAVGAATASAARDAGFTVETIGAGGLQALLGTLAPPLRLLRLSGEARVDLMPPPGITLHERVVYTMQPCALAPDLAARLAQPAVIALHSGEAAAQFAAECDRLAIGRGHLTLVAMAPRIAAMAGTGWADVKIADQASDAALLALARQMCQTAATDRT